MSSPAQDDETTTEALALARELLTTPDEASLHIGGTHAVEPRQREAVQTPRGDGCTRQPPGHWCGDNTVEWVCDGYVDASMFGAACKEVISNEMRFCCPPSFLAGCR
jgi:hypothetical protein